MTRKFDVYFVDNNGPMLNNIQGEFIKCTEQVMNLLNHIFEYLQTIVNPRDRVRLVFDHIDQLDFCISTGFVQMRYLDVDQIASLFENVCQSKTELRFDQKMQLTIYVLKSGYRGGINNTNLRISRTNCIKPISNNDNMCAIRAFY